MIKIEIMKHIIIILQLLIASACYSQVRFNSFVEAGYENRIISIYDYNSIEPDSWMASNSLRNSLFTTFENELNYKGISLYASVKTNVRYITLLKYDPLQAEFVTGISYRHNRFTFRIEHMCSHSIDRLYFKEAYDKALIRYQLF